LLDEPTSNLDLYHQLDAMEQITTLAKEKQMGMLVALHDLNLAGRFSDKIVMMKEGAIFKMGSPEEVITPAHIQDVYGVEAKVGLQNGCFSVQAISCVKE